MTEQTQIGSLPLPNATKLPNPLSDPLEKVYHQLSQVDRRLQEMRERLEQLNQQLSRLSSQLQHAWQNQMQA